MRLVALPGNAHRVIAHPGWESQNNCTDCGGYPAFVDNWPFAYLELPWIRCSMAALVFTAWSGVDYIVKKHSSVSEKIDKRSTYVSDYFCRHRALLGQFQIPTRNFCRALSSLGWMCITRSRWAQSPAAEDALAEAFARSELVILTGVWGDGVDTDKRKPCGVFWP